MPTYQYACTACGEQLEAVQSFSDAALTDCPVCGGRLRKVYSAVGVVFKGSGFYKNDSRKPESNGKQAEKKVDASASSDKSSDKGSGADKGSSSDKGAGSKGSSDSGSKPAASSSSGKGSSDKGSSGSSSTSSSSGAPATKSA